MAVGMRSLASSVGLLRRVASFSRSSRIVYSNSVRKSRDVDFALPRQLKPSGYFALLGQVREYHSEEISSSSLRQVSPAAIAGEYAIRNEPRHDWTRDEIQAIYESPLMDLLLYGVCLWCRISLKLVLLILFLRALRSIYVGFKHAVHWW